MSSCPLTSAFHCSFGLNSDAPGYTCTSRSTPAALASRAMICTISSRTSPRPPGNWCEARSVVDCAKALAQIAESTDATNASLICLMNSSSDRYPNLYHPGRAQPGDLGIALAEAAQHIFGVLTERRRREAILHWSFRKAHRARDQRHFHAAGVGQLDANVARLDLRLRIHLSDVVDRPVRHARGLEKIHPLGSFSFCKNLLKQPR